MLDLRKFFFCFSAPLEWVVEVALWARMRRIELRVLLGRLYHIEFVPIVSSEPPVEPDFSVYERQNVLCVWLVGQCKG
jgi:hypothetical protein